MSQENIGGGLTAELELLENMTPDEIDYVLRHNDNPPFFTEEYHPTLSSEDIVVIKTRAAILMNGEGLEGGDAVCRATKERLAVREHIATSDSIVFDESTRMVQGVVERGNPKRGIADILRSAGRELH